MLVPDGAQSIALTAWEKAAGEIGRQPGQVVHWQNVKNPGQRKHLAATIASIPDLEIISVVLCKFHLPNARRIRESGALYNWSFRLLMERLSWFGRSKGAQVGVTFSQVAGLDPRILLRYVRLLESQQDDWIEWRHLKLPPKVDTPANRRMLQIADSSSGAVFAAFEPDDYGFTEQGYLELLRTSLWARPHRPLSKEGLSLGPWPSDACAEEHPWFEDFCTQAAGR